MTLRMVRWGVVAGLGFGLAVWLTRPLYLGFFQFVLARTQSSAASASGFG